MTILLAGKPLDQRQHDSIRARAAAILADASITPRSGALDENFRNLLSDNADIDDVLINLLRDRSAIDTQNFLYPRKPGAIGAVMCRVRAFLWKLLRYQHDRMSLRQNRVNALIIDALEQRTQHLKDKVSVLEKRICRLESSRREVDDQ